MCCVEIPPEAMASGGIFAYGGLFWGRGDGLPQPVTWFFARGVVVDVRRDTWVPPYIALFCRAGPVCPAVGAGKTRSGRCGHRPLRKRILRCIGEGLCPSRGRPQGSPLRRGYKRCSGWVAREADPYGGLQEVRGFMPGRRWWGCCSRVYRHPRGGGGCGW